MKPIGIIANAQSGKDIRRLVSSASVFNDREKINILKRLFMALDAMDVEQVLIMPDTSGLVKTAIHETTPTAGRLTVSMVTLPSLQGDYQDSGQAARIMADAECGCIITLGGDGTNRIIAGAGGAIPLLPISAGTNNVFPEMIEATIAGMTAAVFAHEFSDIERCTRQKPLLELANHGEWVDMALVDIVVLDQQQTGARAVWEPARIRDLFLSRAQPGDIGLSSIGAAVCPLTPDSGRGLHIRCGTGGFSVLAPIAPGLIKEIMISEYHSFGPDEDVPVTARTGVIALDGEREINIGPDDHYSVRLRIHGPSVIDIEQTLYAATTAGFLQRGYTAGDDRHTATC